MSEDFYAELAASLHAIADDIAGLAGQGLPRLHSSMTLMPLPHDLPDEVHIAAVDTIGAALFGWAGQTRELSGGTHHHRAQGDRDGVSVTVFQQVSSPEDRALRAESERLRAELEQLRAQRAAFDTEAAPGEVAGSVGATDGPANTPDPDGGEPT